LSAAPAILARLTAIGARIECRGERLVVCAGRRPVPMALIADARAAKADLSKALNAAEGAHTAVDEHLRPSGPEKRAEMLVAHEDAHLSTSGEHLRRAAKRPTDTEDAHLTEAMSAFGDSQVFCGLPQSRDPKVLIPRPLSAFDRHEHLGGNWGQSLARLNPDRPPSSDVPLKRWRQFIGDARLFLDRWGGQAAALGWEPDDLFGCDPDRPFARIDQCGLLWLLNGARVVMLAEDAAAMETPTGARHTWRRKPIEPGRVLAWELAGGKCS
jgi:hypothetical protein